MAPRAVGHVARTHMFLALVITTSLMLGLPKPALAAPTYTHPLPCGNDYYGTNYNNVEGGHGNGLDIWSTTYLNIEGDAVTASASGTVVQVDEDNGQVKINHSGGTTTHVGYVTVYAHMDPVVVTRWQEVDQGALLGYVSDAGYATAPHLHYGQDLDGITVPVRWNGVLYGPPNPSTSWTGPDFVSTNCDAVIATMETFAPQTKIRIQGPGSFPIYNANGSVAATQNWPNPTWTTGDTRTTLPGLEGTYFRINAGFYSGKYIREGGPVYAELPSTSLIHFDTGTHVGRRFAQNGTQVGSTSKSVSGTAHTNGQALINGKWYYRIIDGVFSGYWLEQSQSVWQQFSPAFNLHFDSGLQPALTPTGAAYNIGIGAGGSGAPANGIANVGGKWYYRINSGAYTGYFAEQSMEVYRANSLTVHLEAGVHTGIQADGDTHTNNYNATNVQADAITMVDGQLHYRIANGDMQGYWLPESAKVWPVL